MARKILLIEDEEKIARFTELELVHEGYEVTKAFNGREGLELAEKGGFDLVLLDVMLPELNGLEVLRRLRRSSQVPVIMLTARDAVMDKVSGLDAGADDYITKPFAIEELLARIRVAFKKQDGVRQQTHRMTVCGVTVDTDSMSFVVRHYPFREIKHYTGTNQKLAVIYKLCSDTIKYGVQECFVDCPEFASVREGRALMLTEDETVGIMLCEEDHIRVQVIDAVREMRAVRPSCSRYLWLAALSSNSV